MKQHKLVFPCPNKCYKKISIDDCESCNKNLTCDIYPTMLEEDYDMKKDTEV